MAIRAFFLMLVLVAGCAPEKSGFAFESVHYQAMPISILTRIPITKDTLPDHPAVKTGQLDENEVRKFNKFISRLSFDELVEDRDLDVRIRLEVQGGVINIEYLISSTSICDMARRRCAQQTQKTVKVLDELFG